MNKIQICSSHQKQSFVGQERGILTQNQLHQTSNWLLLCYSLLDVPNGVAWFIQSLFLKTPQYVVVLTDLHARAYCTWRWHGPVLVTLVPRIWTLLPLFHLPLAELIPILALKWSGNPQMVTGLLLKWWYLSKCKVGIFLIPLSSALCAGWKSSTALCVLTQASNRECLTLGLPHWKELSRQ